ncbi:hypothetical protein EVAR_27285_1 [Eumeta japonica]|uniref:Uncharacterized protein n=1 Tax=Eumeta variegata TaxID=151549 RepID=A0A4C1UDL6_EUMVA|nr:hypothetical protein EVAR_27285_1 [Eumeta japonica]
MQEGNGKKRLQSLKTEQRAASRIYLDYLSVALGCMRPLSLFYSDESADGVEERSLVPRSRLHARLRRNATISHVFSCVQPAYINL